MKQITNYIIEKFKINSKTVKKDDLSKEIFRLWGFTDIPEDIDEIVKKWIKDNEVTNILPVANENSLKNLEDILDSNIQKEYNSENDNLSKCREYYSKSEKVYKYNKIGERFNIYTCPNMISFCKPIANLYCLKIN